MKEREVEVTQDPKNANKGTVRGRGMLEQSLERLGAGRSVLVDKNGVLIAGNKTMEVAQELGIPVKIIESDGKTLYAIRRTDLDMASDPEAAELALADNRVGQVSLAWDTDVLAQMIEQEGVPVGDYFFAEELEKLFAESTLQDEAGTSITDGFDVDEEIEPPAIPTARVGDLWHLGDHRLIVGDSTDLPTMERLMNGRQADMVWTDPPYGVAIGDKNKYLDSVGHGRSNRITTNLQNDDTDVVALQAMIELSFGNAVSICRPGAVWHVASPAIDLFLIFGQALKDLGIWRQTIIWVKNTSTFSPMGVDYHWQHESMFHGWVPGARHQQPKTRTETTVWMIDRPKASPDHPTMKPVALVQKSIQNHTDQGDLVVDMFLGSGTTLIASEVEHRLCYGTEIDPKYADVILTRFLRATGVDPIREDGESFSALTSQTLEDLL